MVLSDVAIKRPVFTAMVTIGLMALGLLSVRTLGVDLFPDVSFPVVAVVTVYPGAGPEEVEQLVTKQIEEAVAATNGVEEVRSYSRDSVSTVVILFKLEVDVKAAATDIREKVASIRSRLPREIRDPLIYRVDPTALPVLNYAVSSNRSSAETRRLVEDLVKPKLEAVEGVAAVKVLGGQEREVHVYFRRAAIEALGLSLAQLVAQLSSEGFDLPAGRVTDDLQELNVKTLGRVRALGELEDLVVASTQSGAQVRLKDIATVVDGFKEQRTRTFLDGKEAITLEIQKQGGTNTVAIANAVYAKIADLQRQKGIPPDLKLVKAIDASTFIRRNIADVSEAIVIGGLMAICVIFLFMLDWRSTLISSLALPTSIVTTFLAMKWLGFTFNMMSLLGLSLSIGLLIDDAVVVRENIYRHMEMGLDPITAAKKGTSEIGLAVMATTFTIVAVFVPVGFMGGMVGRMFRQFGLTVAAAVLVSLFISFTLDPMMSARVMKPITPGHQERLRASRAFGPIVRTFDALDKYYRGVLAWALDHRKTVFAATTALFFGSVSLTSLMGKEFFSPGDRGEFRASLEAAAGTSLEEMTRVVRRAEQIIRENPEVRTLYTVVGPGEEANKASIRIYTTKSHQRKVTQAQIQEDLRTRLSALPGVHANFGDIQFVDSDSAGQELPITLYVRGDDYPKLQELAAEVTQIVKNTRGTKDVDTSFRPGRPESRVEVDRAKAADLGVSLGAVAQTLRFALEGEVVAKFRDGDRDFDIRAQLAPEDRVDVAMLRQLSVPQTGRRIGAGGPPGAGMMGPGGGGPRLVKIADVAKVETGIGPSTIERMNRQRQISIVANNQGRSLGDVVADIDARLAQIQKPEDFKFVHGGATQRMQETFENMGLALFIAVLFIYFVLASQFESFVHPFTIMLALPLAMIGALILLFVTGLAIGMPAMIGIILLMGLVTKNGILLVDYTNTLRERGLPMKEALLQAGPTRLRPILMTSSAMVLGMLPTALATGEGSEFRAPMSIAVIGGVITSTFLTLLVVPVVYTWLDRLTTRGRAERALAKRAVTEKPPEAQAARAKDEPTRVWAGEGAE